MGTRADFYDKKKDGTMAWLGSIAMDGYPGGNPAEAIEATSPKQFRRRVAVMLEEVDHSTKRGQGWPWPWETSKTTDCAYWFERSAGAVFVSWFGGEAVRAVDHEHHQPPEFPDMSEKANVAPAGSDRSGIMVLSVEKK